MKSILFASKSSNSNQLSVGSQLRRPNESSNAHYHLTTSATSATVDSHEKEHNNNLFSNSKKQVIRNRCSAKSDSEKLKRTTDASEGNTTTIDKNNSEQRKLIKLQTNDHSSDLEYLDNRPLIVAADKRISVESENAINGKSVKLINLRKKNGTLIFQKKSAPKHQPRANEYQELESFKKRRSLPQWPSDAENTDSNNTSRHSWYDPDYYPRAIEEEFDEIEVSQVLFISS